MNNNINFAITFLNDSIDKKYMNKNYILNNIGSYVYVIGSITYSSLDTKYEIVNIYPEEFIELEDSKGNLFKIKKNRCIPSNKTIDDILSKFPPEFKSSLKSIEFLDDKFIFRDIDFIKTTLFNIKDNDLYIITSGNKECFLANSINQKNIKLFKSLKDFTDFSNDNIKIKNLVLINNLDPYQLIKIDQMTYSSKIIKNKLAYLINEYDDSLLIKVREKIFNKMIIYLIKKSNIIYQSYIQPKDNTFVKYIPSGSISSANIGVRHRSGTIKFISEKLYFQYTPEHITNNYSNNNSNTNNQNGTVTILFENFQLISEECNFKIDETLYIDCHGTILLDKKSFILPNNVTIITYTESGKTLTERYKKIPGILKSFKNKKELIEKFRGKNSKYHVFCNKPGKRLVFHNHLLEFSLKPITSPNNNTDAKFKAEIDSIKSIIGNRVFNSLADKVGERYTETKSKKFSDYDDILIPEFNKHKTINPIKKNIIIRSVLKALNKKEIFQYHGMIMKDDKPKIINGNRIITNRNLSLLKSNLSDFSTFEEMFNNFFIYSDKLLTLANENGKIDKYNAFIEKIKTGEVGYGNGTIYLKDFIENIYDITNKKVNTFALFICRNFYGVQLNNNLFPSRTLSGNQYNTVNEYYTNIENNNNTKNFQNYNSNRLIYNKTYTNLYKDYKFWNELLANPTQDEFIKGNYNRIMKDHILLSLIFSKNTGKIMEYSKIKLDEIRKQLEELQDTMSAHIRGGKIKGNRYFKLTQINNKNINDKGRYKLCYKTKTGKINTQTPLNIASKVFSKIIKNNSKLNNCIITIQETTQNSNKKQYKYKCKRIKKTKDEINSSERIIIKNGKEIKIKNTYKNIIKYIPI